jgi:ABC-type transport system involved in multi-copper enzyme maturation permease subunit
VTTFIIARLTLQEARRRKVVWVAGIISLAYLILFTLAARFMSQSYVGGRVGNPIVQREGLSAALIFGLYGLNFLMAAMVVLASVDVVSGEISSNSIHSLASKPLRRWEVLVGKWAGFAGMLAVYLLVMAGGIIGLVYATTGFLPPNPAQGVLLMFLEGLVLMTVSLLGGTFLSTLANGVLVFGLYGLAFAGSWTEWLGSMLNSEAAVNMGIISSLIMPSEALWRRAAYLMQSPLSREFGYSPFASGAAPSPAMVVYGVLYLGVALVLAIRILSRRDL